MSALEETLAMHIRATKLPGPTREHRFHDTRRWRFDFAWPDRKIAAECEGGAWVGGRHNRPDGFSKDMEKYNQAALLGWRVFRFDKAAIDSGRAVDTLREALIL